MQASLQQKLSLITNLVGIIMGSLIWSRDIICLHNLLHRKHFLCSKICKQFMSPDQMRDAYVRMPKIVFKRFLCEIPQFRIIKVLNMDILP